MYESPFSKSMTSAAYANAGTSSSAASERIIFHIDVNSAFLSWEAVYRLKYLHESEDLRLIPSAISGNKENRHGIILAKSIPAKAYGVKTAQTIQEALNLCPDLKMVPPRYALYEKSSAAFFQILRSYTELVEKYSIDEAFLDVTDIAGQFGGAVTFAHQLKDRIYKELGFTVNIGVSNAKLLAKMASDFKKPNLVHTLFPHELAQKMWPLSVRELFFVGRATTKKLRNLGIVTIGDLARADLSILTQYLGKHGQTIYNFANGIDPSPVCPDVIDNKGYGNSTTLDHDVEDLAEAKKILLSLCETVAMRLRKDDMRAAVICVSIRNCYLQNFSHQTSLPSATNVASELYLYAGKLLDDFWDGTPLRQLGVHTSKVTREAFRQIDLFHMDQFIRQERFEQTVDLIRSKFGPDAIKRASFLTGSTDHMTGGISGDKINPGDDKNLK